MQTPLLPCGHSKPCLLQQSCLDMLCNALRHLLHCTQFKGRTADSLSFIVAYIDVVAVATVRDGVSTDQE